MNKNLRIRAGLEDGTFLRQLGASLFKIIEFAVDDALDVTRFVRDGLTSVLYADNGQSDVPETWEAD